MADKGKSLQPAAPSAPPTTITVGQTNTLDLSFLPEDQRNALLTDHAKRVLNIQEKALELGVEANVLRNTLDTLSHTTKEVADAGNSVTMKHEHKTNSGRTEVVMGNTNEAAKGKVMFGGDARMLYLIGAALVVVIVLAVVLGGR